MTSNQAPSSTSISTTTNNIPSIKAVEANILQEEVIKRRKRGKGLFPATKIKKILQSDEAIGKVSSATPVVISRCLELFFKDLVDETVKVAKAKNARTITAAHLKECIDKNELFDFLRTITSSIEATSSSSSASTAHKKDDEDSSVEEESDEEEEEDEDDRDEKKQKTK